MITNQVFSEEAAGMRAGLEKLFCKDHNSRMHEAERSPTHSLSPSFIHAARLPFSALPFTTLRVAPRPLHRPSFASSCSYPIRTQHYFFYS